MDRKRTTGRDIRRQNRSALLSELYFHGPLSRLELAEITGLSPATASNVTAELFGERLIIEAGQVESDGGRPRVLLRVDPEFGQVIGVVVAETDIRVELFDLALTELASVLKPPPPGRSDPASVADVIAAGIQDVIAAAGVDPDGVIGVGVGVPGVVERGVADLVHSPTIGWQGVALAQLLRERGVHQPVFVENGAKTLGQAEMWFGAGQGAEHAVILLIGAGVGAAVFTRGAAYQGASSSAGEWGHTTIRHDGRPCRCGARGCLEAYIGREGILDRYRRARGGRPAAGDDDVSRMESLIAAADRSKVAADLLDETADLIGIGIGNLINLYNPERVLVGGWTGSVLGERLMPRIREAAEHSALPHLFDQASIELGMLGQEAVALGAATLPIASLLTAAADPRPRRQPAEVQPGGTEVA